MKATLDIQNKMPVIFLEPETDDEKRYLDWFQGHNFRSGEIHRQAATLDQPDEKPRFALWAERRYQE